MNSEEEVIYDYYLFLKYDYYHLKDHYKDFKMNFILQFFSLNKIIKIIIDFTHFNFLITFCF